MTTFTYDTLGRILTANDNNGTITYSYDSYGRLHSKSTYDYGTLTYTYDASDEVSSITTSINNQFVGTTTYAQDL